MADVNSTATAEDEDEKVGKTAMPPPSLPVKPKESTKEIQVENEAATQAKQKEEKVPELHYKVPTWSGIPDDPYSLEVLKNGCIISNVDLTGKPFHVFGRLPNCDVTLEHPSVSRYHAVLQYKASETTSTGKGLYIFDFGSTHGTYVNKTAIEPKRYYRVRVGYVIKFGRSSRLYILQGPEEAELEKEEEETQQEEQDKVSNEVGRVMTEEEYERWKEHKEKPFKEDQEQGITWGMGEDAVEEPTFSNEVEENVIEDHNFKDPKKTLRGYFEREGLELEYEVEETGPGHARVYHCRVKLPIETAGGEPLYADAAVTGKKREAVLACASEACRMLDTAGLLRQSSHESKKRKVKNWEENDFYDSDEDSFLDRTGSVEKKRHYRMKRAGIKAEDKADTYETLTCRLQDTEYEIVSIQAQLDQSLQGEDVSGDSLDAFMNSIGSSLNKPTRTKLKRKVLELKKEKQRLNKLIDIARPAVLPSLNKAGESAQEDKLQSVPVTPNLTNEMASSQTSDPEIKSTNVCPADVEMDSAADATTETSSVEPGVSDHVKPSQDNFAVPKPVNLEPKRYKSKETAKEGDGGNERVKEKKKEDKRQSETGSDRKSGTIPDDQQTDVDQKNPEEVKEPRKKKKKNVYSARTEWEAISDPTYSAWTPPDGQTGDGRTSLNDKFGY